MPQLFLRSKESVIGNYLGRKCLGEFEPKHYSLEWGCCSGILYQEFISKLNSTLNTLFYPCNSLQNRKSNNHKGWI